MDKYPIRLVGEPYVPRELDLDMEPPEWHTPWFEADALDADGHHHMVYWPIPSKTNEWLVGHLLTVDDPDFGDVCDWLHPSLILCCADALYPDSSAVDVTAQVSEVVVKEWARDQLDPRDYDALCEGLWWCPV